MTNTATTSRGIGLHFLPSIPHTRYLKNQTASKAAKKSFKFMNDDEIEAAYASESDADSETSMRVDDSETQVEAVEQSFMEHFSQTTSFTFRDTGCSIGLQVRSCCMSKLKHDIDNYARSSGLMCLSFCLSD